MLRSLVCLFLIAGLQAAGNLCRNFRMDQQQAKGFLARSVVALVVYQV